ncbi:MAG: pre-peptidase C-terminal domain-containing protein, partial [Candidatus Bathyarchaeota archaeon]|nr:pre-peptidase C-terminal domain-containing protein [Candidatus Bathyarchaeota archaeon]
VYREGREVPQMSYYYIGDYSVSFTVEVPVTNEPNDPYPPSGPPSGYVYTTYTYSTSTIDPNGDNVRYEFSWGDEASNYVTGWYASGAPASAQHSWTRPGTYQVQVRAQDVYYEYSNWSPYTTVSISQNDAGTGGDSGNDLTTASSISPGSYKGTLYKSNPTDTNDYYKFYAQSGQSIYVSMTPPSGVDFDLQLYDPNGYLKAGSYYGAGYTDSVSYTADSTGYWRIRIYIYSGEGQYSFYVSVYWPGGGGCPILYVYNGTEYICESLLDIHNPDGIDVVYNHTLVTMPQRVDGAYLFRLVEHPQTISHIDQVKLYAILEDKTLIRLPLIWAWHSEDGNVLPQLLFSDDWKTDTLGANWNNGTSQSIDLKFAALNPNMPIIGFIFQIEGNNIIVKV